MMTTHENKNGLKAFLCKNTLNRMIGLWISLGLSLIQFVLLLPYFKDIRLVKISELLQTIGVNIEDIHLLRRYSMLKFLGFVKESGAGILGFPAFLIFAVHCAAMAMLAVYALMILFNVKKGSGYMNTLSLGKGASFMAVLQSTGTFWYANFYANNHTYPGSFTATPIVYVIFILSVLNLVVIHMLLDVERIKYHRHNFFQVFKRNKILFLFLVPCAVFYIINNYAPMAGIYFAFTKFNFTDGLFASPYVGWYNFKFIIKADLPMLTKNTLLYNVVFIVLGNILQIFFAILISRIGVSSIKRTTQTMIFMPFFVSYVILRVLAYSVLEYDAGMINGMLVSAGKSKIDFYNTPKYWPFIITLANIWKGLGYGMVVYLASIMGISSEYYDAAKVDGANDFQQVAYITLPQLRPTFVILLLYSLGGIIRGNFELFYQMVGTNGVLYKMTDILDTYVYRITVTQPLSMGYGSAAGLYQSVFGLVVVLVSNYIIKRCNEDYALF